MMYLAEKWLETTIPTITNLERADSADSRDYNAPGRNMAGINNSVWLRILKRLTELTIEIILHPVKPLLEPANPSV